MSKSWNILLQEPVVEWISSLTQEEQKKIAFVLELLKLEGPQLSRPYADVIQGSRLANLKELRVQSKQAVFRLFFVFDPVRQAIVLCGGDKKGKNEKLFYKTMIELAEKNYLAYLQRFREENK